jgi:hypothetical protein
MAYSARKNWIMLLLGGLILGIGIFLPLADVHAAACPAPTTDMGSVTSTASLPQTATYRVWSRIMTGTAATDNSYSLEIDGANCYIVGDNNAIPTGTWTWVNYQNGTTTSILDLSLTTGSHTFKMIGREDGVKLDRVILTSDTSCVPSGTGDNCGGVPVAPGDTIPPTVSLTAPTAGATLTGTASLSATASDNVGVAGVQFKVDGTNVGAEDTTSPYSLSWDSSLVSNGTHSITAIARDGAGNTTTSTAISITTSNALSTVKAAYNFDENTGTTAADASGNSNTATLSAATWAAAHTGSGLSLNGTTGYASALDSASLDIAGNGTTEAWVKLSALNKWHGIIGKGDNNTNESHNYALEVDNNNLVECILGNGTTSVTATSTTALITGTFYHLACTWDGTNLKLYVNGSLNRTVAQTLTPAANTSPFYIGQFGASSDFTSGAIDDVRLYNRALSASEVSTDSSTPVGNPTPPASVTGDLNNDSHVNIFDLSIILSNYGKPPPATGDINNDGLINIFDLSILLSNYGK